MTFQFDQEPDESKDSKAYRWHGNPPARRSRPAAHFWNMEYNEEQIQSVWRKVIGELSIEYSAKVNTSNCQYEAKEEYSDEHLIPIQIKIPPFEYSKDVDIVPFKPQHSAYEQFSTDECQHRELDEECWIPDNITHWEYEDSFLDEIEMPFAMSPINLEQSDTT